MKKLTIILSIIFLMLSLNNVKADDQLNLTAIQNQVKAEAEKGLEPVLELFSSGFNTGLYAPLSGKIVSLGLQANIVPIKNEGVLTNANWSIVPFPFLYGGVRVPVIGICGLIRFSGFKAGDSWFKVIGLGAGWEPNLIPLINTKLLITYHSMTGFPHISNLYSIGAHIIGSFTKIPFVTPFAVIGLNNTKLQTDLTLLNGEEFGFSRTKFECSLGVKLLFITAEFALVPANTVSISLGFSF